MIQINQIATFEEREIRGAFFSERAEQGCTVGTRQSLVKFNAAIRKRKSLEGRNRNGNAVLVSGDAD